MTLRPLQHFSPVGRGIGEECVAVATCPISTELGHGFANQSGRYSGACLVCAQLRTSTDHVRFDRSFRRLDGSFRSNLINKRSALAATL